VLIVVVARPRIGRTSRLPAARAVLDADDTKCVPVLDDIHFVAFVQVVPVPQLGREGVLTLCRLSA
jgi:hypothetical protein